MKIRICILILLCTAAVVSSMYALAAVNSWDKTSKRNTSAWLEMTQTQANIELATSGKPVTQSHFSAISGMSTHEERYWSKEEIKRAESNVEELQKILPQLSVDVSKARIESIGKVVFATLLSLSTIGYSISLFMRWRKKSSSLSE